MNLTSFNPIIVTQKADAAVELFEALGFERRHNKKGDIFDSVSMKTDSGFHVDVTQADVPRDMTSIRMNVPDFDEACRLLTERGFRPMGPMKDTGTSHSMMMVAPTGFTVVVCQHVK